MNDTNKTIAMPVMVKLTRSHQIAIFYPLMREYSVIIVIRKNVHVAYTKLIIITIMVYLDLKLRFVPIVTVKFILTVEA
jgi:hypothetical protein